MNLLKSIRFKLFLITILPITIIMSLIVYLDARNMRERLIFFQKEKAVLLSDIILKSINLLMLENRWKDIQTVAEYMIRGNPELKDLRIYHPITRNIIVSANSKEIGREIDIDSWERFINNEEAPYITENPDNSSVSKITIIKNTPACHKCHPADREILGVINVSLSLDSAQKYIKDLISRHFSLLVPGFIIIGIIFLVGGEIIINTPIERLASAMKKVESGDLTVRMNNNKDDEIGYLSNVFNNILDIIHTSKKELEICHIQQLEKASKLAAIGEIMSGIAHEIKNPLTGISCAIQVIYSEIKENDPIKPILNEILNQVRRLDRTVKDILDYAKPKPPHMVSADIRDVIKKSLFLIYPEARRNNVEIDVNIEQGIERFNIDTDQIQQVILNLSINAIQAMPDGGLLKIEVMQKDYKDISKSIQMPVKSDKILLMSFQDTGIGIDPCDMDNLFNPFFTKKKKGTGLGLSITQKIINDHKGIITVKSENGKGSIFNVYLPMISS